MDAIHVFLLLFLLLLIVSSLYTYETFDGIGHFLSQGGYCCDGCNWTKVLPARLKGEHL